LYLELELILGNYTKRKKSLEGKHLNRGKLLLISSKQKVQSPVLPKKKRTS